MPNGRLRPVAQQCSSAVTHFGVTPAMARPPRVLTRTAVALTLVCAFPTAHASLVGRLPTTPGGADYQAYYDTSLDITWLANANAGAGTSFDDGFDTSDGRMRWGAAQAWMTFLNTATFMGSNDWRLPSVDVDGDLSVDGCTSGDEPDCRDNELGYMFRYNGVTASSPGPFSNLGSPRYWSGTEHPTDAGLAYSVDLTNGTLRNSGKSSDLYAWAVHDGDVSAVPLPAAVWLLLSSLGAIGMLRRPHRTR
jgi:hypothetical protein